MAIEQGLKSAPNFRARLPRFIASENWNFVPIVLLSVAFLIWMVRSLEPPNQAQPVISPPPMAQSSSSVAQTSDNHLGTTLSLQLAQTLDRLPKPCNIKVTPQSNSGDLPSLISWVVSYGNPSGGAICSLTGTDSEPPDADAPTAVLPTSNPGMVVHWDAKFVEAKALVHFFDGSGVKVSISHRLPPNAPANFIWIDIGPGSPWK